MCIYIYIYILALFWKMIWKKSSKIDPIKGLINKTGGRASRAPTPFLPAFFRVNLWGLFSRYFRKYRQYCIVVGSSYLGFCAVPGEIARSHGAPPPPQNRPQPWRNPGVQNRGLRPPYLAFRGFSMAAGDFEAAEALHGYGRFPPGTAQLSSLDIFRSLLYCVSRENGRWPCLIVGNY